MPTTSPARIDDDLFASAKLVGEIASRSASQQVVHWALIGREVEASRSISQYEIAEVLSGRRSYDTLDAESQALVRADWTARMDALRSNLDLAAEFSRSGRSWTELDADGNVVRSQPSAESSPEQSADERIVDAIVAGAGISRLQALAAVRALTTMLEPNGSAAESLGRILGDSRPATRRRTPSKR